MNRTIKFRGWDKEGKYWMSEDWVKENLLTYKGERIEFSQFCGLLDKNGKEIYEGDILKMHHRLPSVADYYSNHEVYWVDTHYMLGDAALDSGLFQHGDNLEIIGNIYENPELLGV